MGIAIWAVLSASAVRAVLSAGPALEPVESVAAYLFTKPKTVSIGLPPGEHVAPGTGICMRGGLGYMSVGRIARVDPAGRAEAILYPEHARQVSSGSRFLLVRNRRTPAWVVKTLFPPGLRARIQEDLKRFAAEHGPALLEALWPDIKSLMTEAFSIMEEDFLKSLASRDAAVRKLIDKHKTETFQKEIMPVLRKEAWPVIREESAPLVEKIGQELWEKLPMGNLGLRWMAEKVPFTSDDLVRKRFDEYVENEALPILESHTDEFVELAQKVFARLARNKALTAALRRSVSAVGSDREFLDLLEGVFEDVFADSRKLAQCMKSRLSDPKFTAKVSGFLELLTPLLNSTADAILLDASGDGINPELARVLRTQLFQKDSCWFLVESPGGPPLPDGAFVESVPFED